MGRKFIPRVAYAVTLINHGRETAEPDTADAKEIEKESAEAAKLYDWAAYRKKAGFETHLIAGVLRMLPKVGRWQWSRAGVQAKLPRRIICTAWSRRPQRFAIAWRFLRRRRRGRCGPRMQPTRWVPRSGAATG
jgi:hypothetical protein